MTEPLIIAIDGPAGSGKSTVAKRIAAAAQPLLTPDGNTDAAVCARPSERSAAGSSAERNAFPRGGAAERCARRTRPVLCFFFIP